MFKTSKQAIGLIVPNVCQATAEAFKEDVQFETVFTYLQNEAIICFLKAEAITYSRLSLFGEISFYMKPVKSTLSSSSTCEEGLARYGFGERKGGGCEHSP